MALETANFIHQLDPANPSGPDRLAQGDDHLRLIKQALKATFPNIQGAVNLSHQFLNSLAGSVVPVGTITLWYGTAATVPAGYAICNGQTVNKTDGSGQITTPDMRGKVPVGLSGTQAPFDTFGQTNRTVTTETGGEHTHTGKTAAGQGAHSHTVTVAGHALTIDEMPSHGHDLRLHGNTQISHDTSTEGDRTVQTGQTAAGGYITTTGGGQPHTHTASTAANSGTHQHDLTVDAVAAHAHQATVDVTQPSIALHYIMRV